MYVELVIVIEEYESTHFLNPLILINGKTLSIYIFDFAIFFSNTPELSSDTTKVKRFLAMMNYV
jgi:hypothetical protein